MFKQYTEKSSLNRKRSRYVSGGETEKKGKRLGWWERDLSFMERQIDDTYFLITKEFEFRPDLISYETYKTVELEWLVLQYNNIVDINEELLSGKILVLPSLSRAMFDITT